MNAPRRYTMGARADAKAATRLRLLRAALELSEEKMTIEITLDEVASRAGTSVQTVLRHVGSRDGLLDETVKLASADVEDERRAAPGDVAAAIAAVVAVAASRARCASRARSASSMRFISCTACRPRST